MTLSLSPPVVTVIADWFRAPAALACIALTLSALLAVRMFPIIIYLCEHKNLMDEPGDRKVHGTRIPNLGGVGMFVAFTIALTALGCFAALPGAAMSRLLALLCGVTILFFLGIKDDIIGLSPNKKFIAQVAAALAVILLTDLRITSLEGLLGLEVLPYWISVGFTLFVFLLLVNAYNLIDGIDGLAGAFAVCSSACFGLFFLLNQDALGILVACILIGALLGFLKFNLSGTQRVFMGDSGTLFIGFVLAFEAIAFLGLNNDPNAAYRISNAPVLVLAVLSFPLMDTLRVFLLRILAGRNPFRADKNHIHHRLLRLGLSHRRATLLIISLNVLTIGTALGIANWEINQQVALIGALVPLLFCFPFLLYRAGSRQPETRQVEATGFIQMQTAYEQPNKAPKDTGPKVIPLEVYEKRAAGTPAPVEKTAAPEEEESRMQQIFKKRLEAFRKLTTTND